MLRGVLIYASVRIGISQSTCRPPGPDGIPYCCPFYVLRNNTCDECPPGYDKLNNSYNCSTPCTHPSYGSRCGSRCNCSKEECHHVTGCPATTTVSTEMSFEATSLSSTERTITTGENLGNYENMTRLYIRHYIVGVGLVIVAIMMAINIFNIHTYRKRNRKSKETIQPVI